MGVGKIICWGVDSVVGYEVYISDGIRSGVYYEYKLGSYDYSFGGLDDGKPVGSLLDE